MSIYILEVVAPHSADPMTWVFDSVNDWDRAITLALEKRMIVLKRSDDFITDYDEFAQWVDNVLTGEEAE